MTLKWECTPDAVGYRIYRSPVADSSLTEMQLLEEITTPACDGANPVVESYTDNASIVIDTADFVTFPAPLPPGSLGVWHEPDAAGASLNTPREGHASVAVADPDTPGQWFLYAIGGRDAAGAYLGSYEYATLVIDPDGSQTLSSWTEVAGAFTPRAELGAWIVNSADSDAVSGADVWLYIGPGRIDGGFSGAVDASLVGNDGSLTAISASDGSGNFAGYGYGDAHGLLFMFGGAGGSASSGGNSATLCGPGSPGGCGALPDLEPGAWNSLGGGAPTALRVYMGSAQESAFFFVAGGTDGAVTLSTAEQTLQ